MIYCVEDDNSIRQLMLYTLRISGFEAEGFEHADSLLCALPRQTPDLILLDIMLPGMDGMELLKLLRKTTQVPVILATAKGTEYDKVTGLDAGADDYLVKPFSMIEMVSRVRAVLRRTAPKAPSQLRHGDIAMNLSEHTVTVRDSAVALTLKEYDLLHLFMAHPGQVFTRDQLLEQIWGTEFIGESRTVDVHIGTLRNKLGTCGNAIQTVRGVGYRLEKRL